MVIFSEFLLFFIVFSYYCFGQASKKMNKREAKYKIIINVQLRVKLKEIMRKVVQLVKNVKI
jgi:cbb3-type cytochrome oxidase subunit 3